MDAACVHTDIGASGWDYYEKSIQTVVCPTKNVFHNKDFAGSVSTDSGFYNKNSAEDCAAHCASLGADCTAWSYQPEISATSSHKVTAPGTNCQVGAQVSSEHECFEGVKELKLTATGGMISGSWYLGKLQANDAAAAFVPYGCSHDVDNKKAYFNSHKSAPTSNVGFDKVCKNQDTPSRCIVSSSSGVVATQYRQGSTFGYNCAYQDGSRRLYTEVYSSSTTSCHTAAGNVVGEFSALDSTEAPKWTQDDEATRFEFCRSKCDQMDACNYLSTYAGGCVFYKSCTPTRTAPHAGFTWKAERAEAQAKPVPRRLAASPGAGRTCFEGEECAVEDADPVSYSLSWPKALSFQDDSLVYVPHGYSTTLPQGMNKVDRCGVRGGDPGFTLEDCVTGDRQGPCGNWQYKDVAVHECCRLGSQCGGVVAMIWCANAYSCSGSCQYSAAEYIHEKASADYGQDNQERKAWTDSTCTPSTTEGFRGNIFCSRDHDLIFVGRK
jgi:hypothetical protein